MAQQRTRQAVDGNGGRIVHRRFRVFMIGAAVALCIGPSIVAGSSGQVAGAAGAKVVRKPKPTVTDFVASPTSSLGYLGGPVTLSATVTNATDCTFSSGKPVTGIPVSVPCSGGGASGTFTFPANTAKRPTIYKVTLLAQGSERIHEQLSVSVAPPGSCPRPAQNKALFDCNLSDANLAGLNLTGAFFDTDSMQYANLSNSVLDDDEIGNDDLVGANLSGADLSGADLVGDVLSGANLTGADLSGANLSGADLSGANVSGADLAGVNFYDVTSGNIVGTPSALPTGCTLVDGYLVGLHVNLTNAALNDADLTNADLTDTDLTNADLSGADLTGATSGGITGTPSAIPAGWQFAQGYLIGPGADLTGAAISNLNLAGDDLSNIVLTNADLAFINFTGTNLTGADFSGTTLVFPVSGGIIGSPSALPANWGLLNGYLVGPSTNLSNQDLSGWNLSGLDLQDSNFSGADLSDASLSGANLFEAGFGDANLNGTDLSGANLDSVGSGGIIGTPSALPEDWVLISGYLIGPGAILDHQNFSGFDLSDVDLAGAFLTDTNLTNADLEGSNLAGADLTGVTWSNTICPDGTNSDADGGTCVNNEG
jgi:uncharacterized protein YjbI with pentapeptide repeats